VATVTGFTLLNLPKLKRLTGNTKCKFQPIAGHEGPEEEERFSSTLSLTSAIDGGWWLTLRPDRFTLR
jgi:hypothetical protein